MLALKNKEYTNSEINSIYKDVFGLKSDLIPNKYNCSCLFCVNKDSKIKYDIFKNKMSKFNSPNNKLFEIKQYSKSELNNLKRGYKVTTKALMQSNWYKNLEENTLENLNFQIVCRFFDIMNTIDVVNKIRFKTHNDIKRYELFMTLMYENLNKLPKNIYKNIYFSGVKDTTKTNHVNEDMYHTYLYNISTVFNHCLDILFDDFYLYFLVDENNEIIDFDFDLMLAEEYNINIRSIKPNTLGKKLEVFINSENVRLYKGNNLNWFKKYKENIDI